MILIDQHGQWPLIIHNSYVVLIMIKLELLELDRLEYYLLGFDQGGRVNITVGRNIYNDDTVYPIAFNNLQSVNIINIADILDQDGWVTSAIKSITNLKFTYMTAQNSVTGISWIAIGN